MLEYYTRSVYPINWVLGKPVNVATREALRGSDALVDVLELRVSNTALHTTVLAGWTGGCGVHGFLIRRSCATGHLATAADANVS